MKVLVAVFLLVLAGPAFAQPAAACSPVRDADGKIARSEAAKREFARMFPCPSTGKPIPACPGWAIDHTKPLACCGPDTPENMAWVPNVLKSGPGKYPKDRWERKVYCGTGEIVTMPQRGRLEVTQ